MQYYKCSSAVLEMDLKATSLQVYHFLASRADYKKRSCFYAVRTIARQLAISERSVQRGTKELAQKGLLKIESQFAKGRQTTNRYTLLDQPQQSLYTPLKPFKKEQKAFTVNCHINALNSRIKGVALKVYTYLESMSAFKRRCTLSVKEIARHCRISITSVRKALKVLAKAKLALYKAKTAVSKWGNPQWGKNEFTLPEFHILPSRVTGVLRRMSPLLTNTLYNNTNRERFDTDKERNTTGLKKKQQELSRLLDIFAD